MGTWSEDSHRDAVAGPGHARHSMAVEGRKITMADVRVEGVSSIEAQQHVASLGIA
ncbi:hypothetical protein HY632_04055 [Candidatus Uhrbacteria bacterium]|nr:hypothetical protein [Candidatus Uhrbacteria bacterium]